MWRYDKHGLFRNLPSLLDLKKLFLNCVQSRDILCSFKICKYWELSSEYSTKYREWDLEWKRSWKWLAEWISVWVWLRMRVELEKLWESESVFESENESRIGEIVRELEIKTNFGLQLNVLHLFIFKTHTTLVNVKTYTNNYIWIYSKWYNLLGTGKSHWSHHSERLIEIFGFLKLLGLVVLF